MTLSGTAGPETVLVAERPPADLAPPEARPHPSLHQQSRRRFVIAAVAATLVTAVPYLWVLWNQWTGSFNALRLTPSAFFYDLQARAMFHGHLSLANGALGIEAFVHDGRQYTYFGIFPSILRMPVLLLTNHYDGRLTAPSLLLAWAATALFTSLILWRLRMVLRGNAVLGRAEAGAFGVVIATVLGGSVIMNLAATPFVYNEDYAWSVPLTIGSFFALLGLMERPSARRVVLAGALILAASLNRAPTGYASVIGALLVAGWFALGRRGPTGKRWVVPVLAAGLVPFAASCAVTYAKFGTPIGLPMADQVWAHVDAHRRYFLAANGGKAFSFGFVPSTLLAYLHPFGIRFSTIFPFAFPPNAPASSIHTVLDERYPTPSIPTTMPLLFLLSCWGVISSFRPRALPSFRVVRIILVGSALATAGVLLWGYIAERYMADFLPLLVVASGVGLVDVWRRLEGSDRRRRTQVLGLITAAGIYCLAVNLALAVTPTEQMSQAQLQSFVSFQRKASITSLATTVQRGTVLPGWAPAGQLFIAGHCSALYVSSGIDERPGDLDVPGLLIDHYSWIPVEQEADFTRVLTFTLNQPPSRLRAPVPLLTFGNSTLVVLADKGHVHIKLEHSGTGIAWPLATGLNEPLQLHQPYQLTVITDPYLHQMNVWLPVDSFSLGEHLISHYVAGHGQAVVQTTPQLPGGQLPAVTVTQLATPPVSMRLCNGLLHGH